MTIPPITNRMLIEGDNLPFMRWLPDGAVDLIATDPPFSKGKTFASADGQHKFADTWHWGEASEADMAAVDGERPGAGALIDFARRFNPNLAAYLCFMGVRLIEMRRILKDTGSVYLHCDPTASHYLKALMDAVFGEKNFRNSIVWPYHTGGAGKHYYSRKHDIILFFAKSANYRHCPIQVRAYYSKRFFGTKTDEDGRDYNDVYVRDVWEDIRPLIHPSAERNGYPTQKPLALYERIITASSNEGDLVLDPFCGCGTTLVAAERLGRRWIGVDLWEGGYEMIERRLADNLQLLNDANPQIKYVKWEFA